MLRMEHFIKCRICGRTYTFYLFSVADQSACHECVRAARHAAERESNAEEARRRAEYFGKESKRT